MLLELQISDFAIIEHLHLRLETGLTVLTGETGAGKSIIIDALGTLRGEKVTSSLVRAGCSRARVEGVFSLMGCPHLPPLLQEHGLWEEEDENVILTRDISAESGRSVARINGRAVNARILREVGGRLVDIHGQHEGLSLFNTRTHLDMLDRYGGLWPRREQVGAGFARLRQVRDELESLRYSEARRNERIQELRVLVEDVQAADLSPEKEQELVRERSVLQNAARITELVHHAYTALYQDDESTQRAQRPVVESLGRVASDLEELARLDPSAQPLAEQSTDLHYQLEDLSTNIRDYYRCLDFDPQRLEVIEDRLAHIRSLQRKYDGSVGEILEQAANAEKELERLEQSGEHIAELEAEETRVLGELGQHASELSLERQKTGHALAQAVEAALQDLSLRHTSFAVDIRQGEDPQGVPVPDTFSQQSQPRRQRENGASKSARKPRKPRTYQVSPSGIDQVEFLISPNPGEPLKPLARIASGGESARLLLSLKSILSRVDTVPTLIFDEIDVGVGGRAGQVVGQKLWSMTDAHQVICITHLPQVAAFADHHYAISKAIEASTSGELVTQTRLHHLRSEERIDELAAMLDGTPVSEHSRASAREIIERANTIKTGESETCNEKK